MTAPAFTPGSWRLSRAGHSNRLFVRDERPASTAVATVHARLDQEANARLIAAAPDLYEALSGMVQLAAVIAMQVDGATRMAEFPEVIAAHAALAKVQP